MANEVRQILRPDGDDAIYPRLMLYYTGGGDGRSKWGLLSATRRICAVLFSYYDATCERAIERGVSNRYEDIEC